AGLVEHHRQRNGREQEEQGLPQGVERRPGRGRRCQARAQRERRARGGRQPWGCPPGPGGGAGHATRQQDGTRRVHAGYPPRAAVMTSPTTPSTPGTATMARTKTATVRAGATSHTSAGPPVLNRRGRRLPTGYQR